MNSTLPALLLSALTLSPLPLLAQESNGNVSTQGINDQFWEASLPGGNYMVSLSRISSVSMHSYYVKGALVHEVDIETLGSALARFYVLEAIGENSGISTASNLINRAKEIGKEAGNKAGVDPNTSVFKEYPVSTHAKTIEYRIVDKADLDALYHSLKKAWRENRGQKITIK